MVPFVLLWVLLSGAVIVGMAGVPGEPRWALPASVALLGGAVAMSRHRPVVGLLLVVGLSFWVSPGLWSEPFAVPLIVMSYGLGRRSGQVRPALVTFAAVLAVGMLLVVAVSAGLSMWFTLVITLLLAVVFPWLVGRSRRQHRELVHAGWERAEQLEREQRIVDEQARLRERARIAGDMHDSLGHSLSLLALRAGALEVAVDLPEHHRATVAQLRQGAAAATHELGAIVGVLRDDEAAPTAPVHETISHLVERARRSGVPVSLELDADTDRLAPASARAAHRVVQEALTNAVKHAPGAPVTVRVTAEATAVEVRIANRRPRHPARQPAAQGGYGLLGLDERVRLVGGSLRTGPTSDGGFEVIARLPHDATPASVSAEPDTAAVPSESAAQRRRAAYTARRGLLMAIGIPVATLLAVTAAAVGYYLFEATTTVLEPTTFASLRLGDTLDELAPVLPAREVTTRPHGAEPPRPDATTCRYYRSDRDPFTADPIFRLCFRGGALASKDTLTGDGDAG